MNVDGLKLNDDKTEFRDWSKSIGGGGPEQRRGGT